MRLSRLVVRKREHGRIGHMTEHRQAGKDATEMRRMKNQMGDVKY